MMNYLRILLIIVFMILSGCQHSRQHDQSIKQKYKTIENTKNSIKATYKAKHYNYFQFEGPGKRTKAYARDPFSIKKQKGLKKNHNQLIDQVSIKNIKMIGYVVRHNRSWAFVKIANKKIVAVSCGQFLGKEHALIKQINPRKIILYFNNQHTSLVLQQSS